MLEGQGGTRVCQESGGYISDRLESHVHIRERCIWVISMHYSYSGKSISNYLGLDWDGMYEINVQTTTIGVVVDTAQCNVRI